jgi:hypothetical protein
MKDCDLVLEALEDTQRILAEHFEPSWRHNWLLDILAREELVAAQARLKAGYGLRVVK